MTLALRASGFAFGAARRVRRTTLALRASGFALGAARQAHGERNVSLPALMQLPLALRTQLSGSIVSSWAAM